MIKKSFKFLSLPFFTVVGLFLYFNAIIPSTVYVMQGSEVKIKSLPMITLSKTLDSTEQTVSYNNDESINYKAKLLGAIPIKDVVIYSMPEMHVSVSGEPFGIKMFSDGVMIVGFSDIKTPTGYKNPASTAGLSMGDIITTMNGEDIKSKSDIEAVILKNQSEPILVEYIRDGNIHSTMLCASYDVDTKVYRTGMWVRDSSAGIGTMTYYDPINSTFAGLGHAVKDVDTGEIIPLLSGEIVPVNITGVDKSSSGEAGELRGTFMTSIPSGKLLKNCDTGVYGTTYFIKDDNMFPLASSSEIVEGTAYIYTTINGTTPTKYEIEIEKVSLNSQTDTKNMVIKIVDRELLALTGGIVQGMSGSPIVQNGKLIGAVTHVFVNDPTRGYGIFIENMIESAESIAE